MRADFGMPRHPLLSLCLGLGLGVAAGCGAAQEQLSQRAFYDRLDEADVLHAWSALQETLETRVSNQTGLWRNESSGNSGAAVPLRTFRIKTGTYCRDFRETIVAANRKTSRTGTACRTGNGEWIPVERP